MRFMYLSFKIQRLVSSDVEVMSKICLKHQTQLLKYASVATQDVYTKADGL